ncbi:hypothetical protein ACSBR2_023612 [Camellia fascicularis]
MEEEGIWIPKRKVSANTLLHLNFNLYFEAPTRSAQMVKKLGRDASKQYFYFLNRFLSLKLSKVEFNKLCVRIVGRENIPLHNQFIRSILKNACSAEVPPSTHEKEVLKSVKAVGNKEPTRDGHKQSVSNPSFLSNGDIMQLSPRKVRTGTRDRKPLDRPSSFAPNGKTNFVSQQSSTEHDGNSTVVLENGVSTPHDIRRPVQHHQGPMERAENEGEVSHYHSDNLPIIKGLPDGSVSAHSKDLAGELSFEDRKGGYARSLLRAPLGVPSCPASVGGAYRMMPLASSSTCVSSFNIGGLLDSTALRERMEQIAATQGLEGVTMDCANLLNNGLDAYLKGLIGSCVELVGARSGHEPTKSSMNKHQTHLKLVNGVRPGHHLHPMQSSNKPMEGVQERKSECPLSLLDFRVAMELNPQQLVHFMAFGHVDDVISRLWPFLNRSTALGALYKMMGFRAGNRYSRISCFRACVLALTRKYVPYPSRPDRFLLLLTMSLLPMSPCKSPCTLIQIDRIWNYKSIFYCDRRLAMIGWGNPPISVDCPV